MPVNITSQAALDIMHNIRKMCPKARVAWRLDESLRSIEPGEAWFRMTIDGVDEPMLMYAGGDGVLYQITMNLTLPLTLTRPPVDLAPAQEPT